MSKKMFGLLLVLVMALLLTVSVSAAEIISSGTCGAEGDNVTWMYDSNNVLTISGTGRMADFTNPYEIPYADVANTVRTIVIDEGVTYIGDNAFAWRASRDRAPLDSITLPKSLAEIGDCTFSGAEMTKVVYYNAENCKYAGKSLNYGYGYFPRGKMLIIGDSVKSIGANVFYRAVGSDKTSNTYSAVIYKGTREEWQNVNVEKTGNEVLERMEFQPLAPLIRILINNKFVTCDQPPAILEGRTLVPMRAIFEALGAEVSWAENTRTASGVKDGRTVSFTLGSNFIDIDGVKKELDVAAQSLNGRTLIPVRAVAEAFDCIVGWNAYKRYVTIAPKNQQSYKIEAISPADEVLATIHFDENGQVSKVHGTNLNYFTPFLANMCGHTYLDIMSDALYFSNGKEVSINFNYENGIVSSFDINYNDKLTNYSTTYENGKLVKTSSNDKNVNYINEASICIIGEPHTTNNDEYRFFFDECGLLSEYRFGGYFKRTFAYDNEGRLINETANNSGNTLTKFTYASDGKLLNATVTTDHTGNKVDYTVTYKYVNE